MAIDWFSHGASRRLEHGEWMRRGILDVQTEIGVGVGHTPDRPVLIGHSMRGLASLAYAANHPGGVSALVMLAPVAPARFGGDPIESPRRFRRLGVLSHPASVRSEW